MFEKEAGTKKLFATTTTPKKIVCVDEMSIPPLQKNNGPSLTCRITFIFISLNLWMFDVSDDESTKESGSKTICSSATICSSTESASARECSSSGFT
jgi:hypothetical protein